MKIIDLIPNVEYDNGNYTFKNIFYKYNLKIDIEDKYLQVYHLNDGQTLEDISYYMYDDTIYFWTIMIVNNFNDPIFDLPMSDDYIQELARSLSYTDGDIDLSLYASNYDTLSASNDLKRNIKVIKREYLSSFLTEMIRKYNE